jgi:hypothetical protein
MSIDGLMQPNLVNMTAMIRDFSAYGFLRSTGVTARFPAESAVHLIKQPVVLVGHNSPECLLPSSIPCQRFARS